jgi:acetyl-CoA carboxylase carboxyl transferase alpha subunit/acetyl-CoA carboxylase carboxyl transferase beta subunit
MGSATSDGQPWVLCTGCRTIVYRRRWDRNLGTCPECGVHSRVTARQRIGQLLDPGSERWIEFSGGDQDLLGFTDTMPYLDRLAAARKHTGLDEAVICARGTVDGEPLVVAAMDFGFLGGSLGAAAGERIARAAEAALRERVPFLVVAASGGARMQEGPISLMQMAKTSAAFGRLDEAGILTVSLITDPTFGGVAASFATLADVIIAEPGARLGFAGRRVIEQTIRQELPENFQTAEFLLERGFIDMVVPRTALRTELTKLLRAASDGKDEGGARQPSPAIGDPGLLPDLDPWGQVRAARRLERPMTLDYIALVTDDFQELHGDRVGGDCPAMVCGLARLDGRPVAVIGQHKGHKPGELAARNYGMATPAGYRKAARVMRMAAKLGLPVVTLVDTPGAYPAASAEEQGQAVAIAENLRLMMGLPVPVVSVVIGEGGSGGALGIAVANRVLILANAVYSVISPEGCASILWRDPAAAPRAAAELGLSSRDLLRLGVVDGVLPEPKDGAGSDPAAMAETLRQALAAELTTLSELEPEALVEDRRARFAQFGATSDSLASRGAFQAFQEAR